MNSDQEALEQSALERLDSMSTVPKLQGPIGRVIGWVDTCFLALAVTALVAIAATVLLQISSRLFFALLDFLDRRALALSIYLYGGVIGRSCFTPKP